MHSGSVQVGKDYKGHSGVEGGVVLGLGLVLAEDMELLASVAVGAGAKILKPLAI